MDIAQRMREGAQHYTGNRFAEAEHCFRAVLAADPGNADAMNGLGVVLHEQGRLEDAERLLAEAIQRRNDFPEAHFNLGRLCLEREQFERALDCFEEVLRRSPADADALASTGIALERKGEFREAEEYFAEAAQFSRTYAVARMLRFSAEFLQAIGAVNDAPSGPATILESEPDGPVARVALVTCDPGYLRKYGPAFARSFATYGDPASLLHLHVLDPDADMAAEARAMLDQAGITRYRVTAERDARFAPGSRAKFVWYTCARFLHLDAWLSAYRVPIVVLDIDAAVQAPLVELVDCAKDADLGLWLRRPRRAPWLDVPAGTLVARPTAVAQDYLRLVRNYIEHFLALGPEWHLDQCALYCTLRMLESHGQAPRVRWMTEAVQAAVFHVGHSHDDRMADPRYARFAANPL